MIRRPPRSTLFPLHDALPICPPDDRHLSRGARGFVGGSRRRAPRGTRAPRRPRNGDRKSTRLNSSHGYISYAVFCLKKKKKKLVAIITRSVIESVIRVD